MIGGFLGAGKTTLALALARRLRERGERVAVITNDQGRSLVDTSRWEDEGARIHEITGGASAADTTSWRERCWVQRTRGLRW